MENIHENCSTLIIQHGGGKARKRIEKLRNIFEYKKEES